MNMNANFPETLSEEPGQRAGSCSHDPNQISLLGLSCQFYAEKTIAVVQASEHGGSYL